MAPMNDVSLPDSSSASPFMVHANLACPAAGTEMSTLDQAVIVYVASQAGRFSLRCGPLPHL